MDHRGGEKKVPPIRGNMVHFPGKKGEMAVESTFSAGKCTKKAGKWFTFPEKRRNGGRINIFGGKVHQKSGKVVHFPGEKRTSG